MVICRRVLGNCVEFLRKIELYIEIYINICMCLYILYSLECFRKYINIYK